MIRTELVTRRDAFARHVEENNAAGDSTTALYNRGRYDALGDFLTWLDARDAPARDESLSRAGPSGTSVGIPWPAVQDIRLEDLVHSIAQQPRLTGWLREQLSGAQHSIEVGLLCRDNASRFSLDPQRAQRAGMAHDLHEGLCIDVSTPIKRHLGCAWSDYESQLEARVHEALGIVDLMRECAPVVAWADAEMLVSDVHRFGNPGTYHLSNSQTIRVHARDACARSVHFARAQALPWRQAKRAFLVEWARAAAQ